MTDLERNQRTYWGLILKQLIRDPSMLIGTGGILTLALAGLAAPLIAPHDPYQMDLLNQLRPPSSEFLLGTDHLGRDVLTRILFGARITLSVAVVAVAIGSLFGTVLGLLAGYFVGWVDMIIMRFNDILQAFPGILLALAIIAVLGPGMTNVMLAVGVATIPGYLRMVRGAVLSARSNMYVEAAKLIGCRERDIMFKHILPNVLAPVIVVASLGTAVAILYAAALSFLGLGAQPPIAEWGAMLSGGRDWLSTAWWVTTVPGIAIMIAVISINLMGDALRDAFDPKLNQR